MRVRIDETRRDPFEFIALRVSDMRSATKHWESLGMSVVSKTDNRKKFKRGGSYGLYQETGDAFDPEREADSIQMGFNIAGDTKNAELSTGLLLLPPKPRTPLALGNPPISLTLIAKPPAEGKITSPDGLQCNYVGVEEFEAGLRAASKGKRSAGSAYVYEE